VVANGRLSESSWFVYGDGRSAVSAAHAGFVASAGQQHAALQALDRVAPKIADRSVRSRDVRRCYVLLLLLLLPPPRSAG
jgi:hypothetical protein